MPHVHIYMEPRDEESKHRIAREVADAMAEGTNNSLDGIQMVFHEVPKSGWARGLMLSTRRPPRTEAPPPGRAEHVSISRIKIDDEKAYLALRNEHLNPTLAKQEGFVSTMLLRMEADNEYWLLNKWLTKAHADAWVASPEHRQLEEKARAAVPGRSSLERRSGTLVHQVFGSNGGKVLDPASADRELVTRGAS